MKEKNTLIHGDCLLLMKEIPDNSINAIVTDPPYKYLKHKLDKDFDENIFFKEAQRVLKKDGMIVIFGRGEAFYRWGYILQNLGFKFKEEIIWDKKYITSPLLSISRVHETISIWTNGNGKIIKRKVPYLEMKKNDFAGIIRDIKRLKSALNNPKSLKAVKDYLKNNKRDVSDKWEQKSKIHCSKITKENKCVSVARAIKQGMNEKSIIRTDIDNGSQSTSKHKITRGDFKTGNSSVAVLQMFDVGMNEKSIIKQQRDHYKTKHPTQKPIRLMERLIQLVSHTGDTILDPFAGSASTLIAAKNLDRNYIGFEIDKEYYEIAKERIQENQQLLAFDC